MIEKSYYLAFSNFSGIGPIKFLKLLKTFGSAKDAWNASENELLEILKPALSEKFFNFRKEFEIEKNEENLLKKKINFICLFEDSYPSHLKQIKNPPIILYSKGNKEILNQVQNDTRKFLAVVGTRKVTSYGRSITQMFSGELAKHGIVIVSGLAIGVDGLAHSACLDANGITVAVLGNGVDICYPRENQKIYDRILENNGIIISELPPGEAPNVGSFPSRNRIVAGLCDAVLVTEGASDSGSLITANFGLEFGRKVFAVPGPITSQLSAAPLRLIEKGAKLVVSPEDILKEFKMQNSSIRQAQDLRKGNIESQKFKNLTPDEKKIIELIENEPMGFDEIVRSLKLDPSKVGSILSMMEIKGLIKSSGGSYFIK